MRIAILGTGSVGTALADAFGDGHDLVLGTRRPDDPETRAAAEARGAATASYADAVRGADLVALATPFEVTEDLLEELGDLGGAVVLDATNPLKEDYSGLSVSGDDSAGERIGRAVSNGRVVKGFCSVGAALMPDGRTPNGPLMMPVAGDDDDAKRVVMELAEGAGFEPFDLGPLSSARYLEAMAMMWIRLRMSGAPGSDAFGFAVLRR